MRPSALPRQPGRQIRRAKKQPQKPKSEKSTRLTLLAPVPLHLQHPMPRPNLRLLSLSHHSACKSCAMELHTIFTRSHRPSWSACCSRHGSAEKQIASPFALAINTHPCLHPNLAIVRTISFDFGQLGVPVVIVLVVQGRSVDLRGPTAACRPTRSPLSIEPYLVLLPDLSCHRPA